MGIRESLNKNPTMVGIGAGVIVLAALVMIFSYLRDTDEAKAFSDQQAFFTDDDGKTWFKDLESKVPPFDHNGKEAVRCYVYEAGGTKFVGWLEKYSPAGKEAYIKQVEDRKNNALPSMELMNNIGRGRQIKRPGDKMWYNGEGFVAIDAKTVPPAGVTGTPVFILP